MDVPVLSDDQRAERMEGDTSSTSSPVRKERGDVGQEGVEVEEQAHKKEVGTEGMRQLMLSQKENVF